MLIRIFDKIIVIGLLVLIVFSVLAHGTVESWSIAIFQLLTLLIFIVWTIKYLIERRVKIEIPLAGIPIGLFFILAVVQSISFERTNGSISSLSFDPGFTRTAAIAIGFLFFAYIIAANQFVSNKRFMLFANFLTIFGFLLAVFGLIQYFTWNGRYYWLREMSTGGLAVSGPFVNKNNFAGLMELIIPIPIGLVISEVQRKTRLIYAFASVIMIVAAFASLSRGGIFSLTIGIFFMLSVWFIYSHPANRKHNPVSILKKISISVGLIAAVAVGTIWIAGESLSNRLTDNNIVDSAENPNTFIRSRGWIWENSWSVFRENPWTGTGIGTFPTAFPNYSSGDGRDAGNFERLILESAHNDYLQVLTDTGLVGAIILLGFLVILADYMRRIFSIDDPVRAVIAIAASASILMLLIHSIFDFNLQITSNVLLFLVMTALLGNAVAPEVDQTG